MSEVSTRILSGLFESRTGQQLSASRRWRIGTALSGLFRERGISGLDELVARLAQTRETALARQVVEALLNNETYFFRDRAMFDLLATKVLPELALARAGTRRLSIWSAGCSTGQEALSLAMLFAEQEAQWQGWTIDIFGTDVSEAVIESARAACYSQFEVQRGLAVGQMLRWFEETPQGWQASDRLRRMIRFEVHNILEAMPNFPRFDLVLCRNVLLYFEGPNRTRAFDRVASLMAPDAWLMLGAGETVIGQTERLTPDGEIMGLYRLADAADPRRGRSRRATAGARPA
jgi:chemotaxis protein methyltransferase CheR